MGHAHCSHSIHKPSVTWASERKSGTGRLAVCSGKDRAILSISAFAMITKARKSHGAVCESKINSARSFCLGCCGVSTGEDYEDMGSSQQEMFY